MYIQLDRLIRADLISPTLINLDLVRGIRKEGEGAEVFYQDGASITVSESYDYIKGILRSKGVLI